MIKYPLQPVEYNKLSAIKWLQDRRVQQALRRDMGDKNIFDDELQASHPSLSKRQLQAMLDIEGNAQFSRLNNEDFLNIGLDIIRMVKSLPDVEFKPVIVDIEVNGQVIFHYAMPGSSLDNADWISRKKRTVKRFGHSSYYLGRSLHLEGKTWSEKYDLDVGLYAAHGGCVPIFVTGGIMVGTITISGLAQVLDHVLATRAVSNFLGANH